MEDADVGENDLSARRGYSVLEIKFGTYSRSGRIRVGKYGKRYPGVLKSWNLFGVIHTASVAVCVAHSEGCTV